MITKTQIEQQKQAIEGLYEKVMEAPDSERKTQAVAYCEGCIAACSLALQVMSGTISSDEQAKAVEPVEEKAIEAVEVEEKAVESEEVKEKPKRKSSKKKKEEPVEVVEPEEPEVEEEEDDDLDDLL